MAKLYRVIPDVLVTALQTRKYSDVSEDLFYKLGYISVDDHTPRYFTYKNEFGGVTQGPYWTRDTEPGIFFYFNPWDALQNMEFFLDHYGHEAARIFEYEIPDEIIDRFPSDFSQYTDTMGSKEVIVPLSYLTKDSVVKEEIDQNLKNNLLKVLLNDSKEMIKFLHDYIVNDENLEISFWDGTLWKGAFLDDKDGVEKFLAEVVEDSKDRRLENCGKFFKSDIITGKSMIITMNDRKTALWGKSEPENYIEKFNEFCEKSNGIFTVETYREKYRTEHIDDFLKKR